MTNYNSISNEQITNQLVKVFGNPSIMEDYNRPSAGSMWDMFAGWCGSMSPANRAAFVEAFGIDRVNECEQEARQSIENNELYYKCSEHHRHSVEADTHETIKGYTPRVNDFVLAVYSGLKCDDGRGIYGEIESALNYADEERTNLKNLCHVFQVYEVSNAEFLNEHLADELVHNYTQSGDHFPGGYSTDDPDAHDLLDEYRYYFTETAAVVNRDNGKWFLIDSEGYDYPRYCLMPTNWREMYADEVAAATERDNTHKAEEARKAEEEKNARFAAYMERCAKWEPIMTDCRPLVEAYNKAGHRTPEEKTAQRKLNDARRNNIAAMVRAAFPGLKFRVHKNNGWGAEYTIEYTDGPTLEEFNNAVDYDLFARTTDEFDGMTDYAYTEKKEFTAFADKYMCMDFGGEVKAERDHSPEHRAQMVAQFAEALPGVSISECRKYSVDEFKALAAAWGLDWIDLSNIALDCYGSNPDGELLLYAVFRRMNLYTRPEDTTPTDPKPRKKSSTDTTPGTDEAPAEGLALVEIAAGVAVVGDSRATYRNRKAIKAHGATWNKADQQWQATTPEAVAALRAWFGIDDNPTPEPDPTGTDPTEQKTDSQNTATPTGQKCPAPLITTADTSNPAAMKEAAENVREWCVTDQLADPTPYAAEFDNVAALAWAVLNNYTPTEAEQMTAAALQLSAKMQRRANEINEATAAMEEANRQEYDPEQWKANREEIEQFERYAEDLTMYAEGLAAAVGVPDWQLCDVAAISEPQNDPAQLAMEMEIPEAPAPAPDVLQTLPAKNYQLNEKYITHIEEMRRKYGSHENRKEDEERLNEEAAAAPAILYSLLKCNPDATVEQAHDALVWENYHTLCWHPEVIEDIMRRMLAPLSQKNTEAAHVTDAEIYKQAARIRATYEALKAEAETETTTPSNQKTEPTPSNQKLFPNVWAGKIDKTKRMQFAHLYDYKDGVKRHQPIIFYGTKKGLLSWIWQQLSGRIINERLTGDWESMGRGRNEWRMYDENGNTAFIVTTQEYDAQPQLEILRAWNPDSLSDYERKIVRENDPNEDAASDHFNDLADNDPEGTHNVYYRIDVPYYVDSICAHNAEINEMAEIALCEFYEEITAILQDDGWTNKPCKWNRVPEMVKGTQCLYCHPQNISGNVNTADVERLFNLFLTAKTFTTNGADDYGAARHSEPIKTLHPIGASCAVPVAA